jgi:uncharacterized protein (DUF1800 family)
MAGKKDLTKDDKIKKEVARLKKIFKDLDGNLFATVLPLIQTAAFMSVTLGELEDAINRDGCVSEYQNGENQFGVKRSPQVDIHIAMTKNHAAVIRQLVDLVPPEKRKESRLAALRME